MRRFTVFIFLAVLILIPQASTAQKKAVSIDVSPLRVVIEQRERTGEFNILNTSNRMTTYRIRLSNKLLEPNGKYTDLDGPVDPAFNPDEQVRISPRQFTLSPGVAQRVRFSVRRPPELPEKDYYFHATALRIPDKTDRQPSPADGQGASLGVKLNVAIALPVIVRNTPYNPTARIENIELIHSSQNTKNQHEAVVTINPETKSAILSKLTLYWLPAGSEEMQELGLISNVNIFPNIDQRIVRVPLSAYPSGSGKVIARLVDDYYNQTVIDEVSLQL